jgi:hypothetical protein
MSLAYIPQVQIAVTNRSGDHASFDERAFGRGQQGAGRQIKGTCRWGVTIGKQLSIAVAMLGATASSVWATTDSPSPAKTSFAYSTSHTVKPLPASVIERIAEPYNDSFESDSASGYVEPRARPVEVVVSPRRQPSRDLVCSAVASVAQANNLPVPFFANLIWQESSFDSRTISRAGAQGIAQFMPQTAVEVGLINPFEPIHALNAAGKFVSDLRKQFGNLGLAAAAYNAGPRRIADWLAKRGDLPAETRNYVVRVTGKAAEDWIGAKNDPEMLLMPAKAPCAEVVEAVQAQAKTVKTAKLISELASTASQMRDKPEQAVPAEVMAENTERGWRARVGAMVLEVLRRLEDRQVAAKTAAAKAARHVGAQAMKTAQRDKADERAMAKAARRPEIRTFVPLGNRNAPKSTDRELDRSALLVASRDESMDTGGRDFNGLGKIDLSKTEPAGPEITRSEMVGLGDGRADEAKPDAKESAKRAQQPRRSARVIRFSYSDSLRPY